MRRLKFILPCLFLFITQLYSLPNLTPTTPAGWDAPLVVSVAQDLTSEDTLYTNNPYYYSWAVINNGDQDVTHPFNIQIIQGDSVIKSYRPTSLNAGAVMKVTYLQHKVSIPGNYTMRLVVDSLNEVAESNENDNEYSHSFYWAQGGIPDIYVNPDSLYYTYAIPDYKYASCSWTSSEVVVNIDIPAFDIEDSSGFHNIKIAGFENLHTPGKPSLPFKLLTIAVPPGAVIQDVQVTGIPTPLTGTYAVAPAPPVLPLYNDRIAISRCYEKYNANKQIAYSSDALYPSSLGQLISTNGFRKYNLATVAIYPVLYRASKGELQYASRLQVVIRYTKDSYKESEFSRLESDNLFDITASSLIYNWNQAQEWYVCKKPAKSTYDYVIVTSSALEPACSTIVNWKASLGYLPKVVTTEWIDSNYNGVDVQQKIRNFLRDKYPVSQWGIKYVLIVGDYYTVPMRICYIVSNDFHDDTIYYPIPSDLYYADLTNPDSLSWDKDGDNHFGEALNSSGNPGGDDSPDYISDVYVGRIPWSDISKIHHISNKIIKFEQDTNLSYKKKSLLAGGILYYSNEDGHGGSGTDGAKIMESMMNNGIISRSDATTLYEKEGLKTSTYSSTDKITESNIIKYWQGIGIFAEHNHGNAGGFARKVWATDDGDNIPETTNGELVFYTALYTSDVDLLDDNRPAVGFLNSCLNGYPETINNMGAALLYHGCISTCSASRISYTGTSSITSLFYSNLLKDTVVSGAKTGAAFALARKGFMDSWGDDYYSWITILEYNLYSDPSLYHFGYKSNPCVNGIMWVHNKGLPPINLSVSDISYSAPWIIDLSPTSMNLAPGESTGVSLIIQPAGLAEGTYKDTLRISSNDTDEPLHKELVVLKITKGGVSEETSSITPAYVELKVSPNPFYNKAVIRYSGIGNHGNIPKAELSIYDVTGRLVKTFPVTGKKSSITWDATPYPSGIYFARLAEGDLKAAAKLILMK